MGVVYRAECKNCGYSKRLFAGGGRNDCMPPKIGRELSEEKQALLKEIISNGAKRVIINRIICACKDCGEIYALPIVSYTLDGEQHELKGDCPKCSSENAKAVENNVPCPICKAEITLTQAGLWD